MKQWLKVFLLPALAHELLHYIPAFLLGLNPRIAPSWQSIRYQRATHWQRLVVILFPFATSLLIFIWVSLATQAHLTTKIADIPYLLHWSFWLGWVFGCITDVYKVVHFLLFKSWPDRKDENHE